MPEGLTSADITISLNDDTADENNETVIVTLGTPTGATLGTTTVHTATILDNDFPVVTTPNVTLSTASQSGSENAGPLTVTATLSQASESTVTVPFTVSGTANNGTDFTVTSSPFSFAPGVTTASISINVTDDLIDEGNETVVVTLGTPVGANLGGITTHIATIIDNDGAPISDSRIIIPRVVATSHVIAGDDRPTAILFQALADTVLTVGQIGTTSAAEQLTLLDENLAPQGGQNASGLFEANLVAGGLYALIFQARDEHSIFVIRSSAGPETLSGASPTNLLVPTDVNADGESTTLDALMIINQLNRQSVGEGEEVDAELQSGRYYDVNGDGRITAGDALRVINELASQSASRNSGGGGELAVVSTTQTIPLTASRAVDDQREIVAIASTTDERAIAFESVTSEWIDGPVVVVEFDTALESSANVDDLLSDELFLDELSVS